MRRWMQFRHGSIEYFLDDAWWRDAGMEGFRPTGESFRSVDGCYQDRRVQLVAILEVEPLQRKLSHGVFNDSVESGSAKDRVIRILCGFRSGSVIPPVEVDRLEESEAHRFRLRHGAHRFYCAVAAGFTHVPAIVYEPTEWKRR